MARSVRIELTTNCLEGSCSIQLSYERDGTPIIMPHKLENVERGKKGNVAAGRILNESPAGTTAVDPKDDFVALILWLGAAPIRKKTQQESLASRNF